jgi:hypothetical protein
MFATEMTQLTDIFENQTSLPRRPDATAVPSDPVHADPSPSDRAIYQQARLRLGILGVGTGVLMSVGALGMTLGGFLPSIHHSIFGDVSVGIQRGITTASLAAACLGCVMVVWQWILDSAGRRLDATHRLHTQTDLRIPTDTGAHTIPAPVGSMSSRQLVEAARWLVGFIGAAVVVSIIVSYLPTSWPAVLIALAGFGVLLKAFVPARPPGTEIATPSEWQRDVHAHLEQVGLATPRLTVIDIGETTLAGGSIGRDRVWVSRAVAETSAPLAASLIARELVHRSLGHRTQSALISFLSLAAGVVLAFVLLRIAGQPIASDVPSIVLTLIATMTLLSFASLFIYPAIGRRHVFVVDRFIAERFGMQVAKSMLDALARANLPDESLPGGKAYVFHPIPTMARRRAAIESRGAI